MNRFENALLIVNPGASNPSGIAHTIVATCREIMDGREYGGTISMYEDEALRLIVHQLAYICRASELDDLAEYSRCLEVCRKGAGK